VLHWDHAAAGGGGPSAGPIYNDPFGASLGRRDIGIGDGLSAATLAQARKPGATRAGAASARTAVQDQLLHRDDLQREPENPPLPPRKPLLDELRDTSTYYAASSRGTSAPRSSRTRRRYAMC
jgi:hypothetical protein